MIPFVGAIERVVENHLMNAVYKKYKAVRCIAEKNLTGEEQMTYEEMAAKAKEEGRTKKLTVEYHAWTKEEQSVTGKLVAISDVQSTKNQGKYKQYVFHTEAGMVKFQCGAFFDNEQGQLLAIGSVYEITYKGKKKLPNGNSVNLFDTLQIGEGNAPAKKAGEFQLF